jgi:hypothetical protein
VTEVTKLDHTTVRMVQIIDKSKRVGGRGYLNKPQTNVSCGGVGLTIPRNALAPTIRMNRQLVMYEFRTAHLRQHKPTRNNNQDSTWVQMGWFVLTLVAA